MTSPLLDLLSSSESEFCACGVMYVSLCFHPNSRTAQLALSAKTHTLKITTSSLQKTTALFLFQFGLSYIKCTPSPASCLPPLKIKFEWKGGKKQDLFCYPLKSGDIAGGVFAEPSIQNRGGGVSRVSSRSAKMFNGKGGATCDIQGDGCIH